MHNAKATPFAGFDPARLDPNRPVLIAGPTASGKSALAARIVAAGGGVVVNADALQVYACWRVLTARPTDAEAAALPHLLYGHVCCTRAYSVGDWLREVAPLLETGPRPVIVGGTGLYFSALTDGLADIPGIPGPVRAEAEARIATAGIAALAAELDPETAEKIDLQNPVRVQRAWEVLKATGRGLVQWQHETGPPVLALTRCQPILIEANRDWLGARIAARFDRMLADGALDEARANHADWDPKRPSARAIGSAELIAHLEGRMTLDAARNAAITATRQYAKRQRSWFRQRFQRWPRITVP